MLGSILYCGDTELNGAAAYLAGLMTHWGWPFDYIPSHVSMTPELLGASRSLLILSDYPAVQFSSECQQLAVRQIEQGCGLLMIGGWESYHGLGGDWDGTAIGSALPVEIQTTDDRVNFPQSAWLLPTCDHETAKGLPWQACPPAIGGMNQVRAKVDATVVLEAHACAIQAVDPSAGTVRSLSLTPQEVRPALVVGHHGAGRTASFLSDVAPHWVGGLVDWGLPRVTGQAAGGPAIEVGHDYAQLWKQLLNWTAGGNTEIDRHQKER